MCIRDRTGILLRIYQEKVQEKVLKDSELEALKQFIDDGDADKANEAPVSYTHLDVYKRQGYPSGTLVVADKQESGKGRRGRSWVSPSGTGIFMTLMIKPDICLLYTSDGYSHSNSNSTRNH